jgi:hypothetical protein
MASQIGRKIMTPAPTRTNRPETHTGSGKHPDETPLLCIVSYPDSRETEKLFAKRTSASG